MYKILIVFITFWTTSLSFQKINAQDVSGDWQGVLMQGGYIFPFSMRLVQNGINISGISILIHPNTAVYYCNRNLSGTYINGNFSFSQTSTISELNPPFQYWCFLNGTLYHDSAALPEKLSGNWYASSCSPGTIEMWRMKTNPSQTNFCPGATKTIQVTGNNVRWYNDSLRTNLIDTGNTYTPNINNTQRYYLTQTNYNTESPVASVLVQVKQPNDPTCGPLPLQFVKLNGVQKSNNSVVLNWQTEGETNTDYFIIERGFDGSTFEKIGNVKASGTQSSMGNYAFVDYINLNRKIYYRIKCIDRDGLFTYSKTIVVKPLLTDFSVIIYPTLTWNSISAKLISSLPQKIEVLILNSFGQIIKNNTIEIPAGSTTFNFNTTDLSNGTYNVIFKGYGIDKRSLFIKIGK